jgi:hypothetical protein
MNPTKDHDMSSEHEGPILANRHTSEPTDSSAVPTRIRSETLINSTTDIMASPRLPLISDVPTTLASASTTKSEISEVKRLEKELQEATETQQKEGRGSKGHD